MGWVKILEGWAKRLLALVLALLLWRPGRRRRAAKLLERPRSVLLVRPDNRVGEALLLTPLLSSLKALPDPPRVEVLVHEKVRRVLAGHPDADEVIAFDRRALFLGPLAPGIRAQRRRGHDVVVDCGNWEVPSITSAILARLMGPRAAVVGPWPWPARWLHDVSVRPLERVRNEVQQRLRLLSVLPGFVPRAGLSFRAPSPSPEIMKFQGDLPRPYAVVNPGGRLGWRRVPPEVFLAAAGKILELGMTPVITWGPGEEGLAQTLASKLPKARLAPPTSLDDLAHLMAGASFCVCNNTGPMHLSVAVGTPTLALFLRMDAARWGHAQPPHRVLDLTGEVAAGRTGAEAVLRATQQMAGATRERATGARSLIGLSSPGRPKLT